VDITDGISGGNLKGWLEVRDELIPEYMAKLDELATGIMDAVNDLHQTGYGTTIDSGTGDPYTGLDFFSGSSASDMQVNSEIVDDNTKIAAAKEADAIPGDNRLALEIAGLQNDLTMNSATSTFSDFYSSLVSDVGSNTANAQVNYDHETSMVTYLENYRESVSGVSLDEEMINLIKFQHAYESAAKVISTVDEMLQTVIGMV
jgi:flagellar hook-associated protein 1 FlgK